MTGFRQGFRQRLYGPVSFGRRVLASILVGCLVLCGVGELAAATLGSDVEALIAIKAAVDPETIAGGSCVESWDFLFDPCESASPLAFVCGVQCSVLGGNSRVTSLTLSGGGYKGTLSPYMGNLSALQSADFSGNRYEGEIPSSLGGLKELLWLDLSSNLLSGVIPVSLGYLPNLQYLSLSNNKIDGRIPSSFSRLVNLTTLYLFRNSLTGGLPRLENLTQLTYLDASNNLLSGHLPVLPPLQLLRVVLRGNAFSGRLPRSVKLLSQLQVLDLSSNNLTAIVGSFAFKLPALQQLNLSRNYFTAVYFPRFFPVASELVVVDLGFNKLRGTLPSALGKLVRLSALTLSQNLLSGPIPDVYAQKAAGSVDGVQVVPFSQLYLDGNYLTGEIPPAFSNLPSDFLRASFVNNCLQSCPSRFPFCQGGDQRDEAVCESFQRQT